MRLLSFVFALFVLLVPQLGLADSGAPARLIPLATAQLLKMPDANKLVVPVAQFYRVDEGVFELEVGKSIDLTDRKLLLSVQMQRRDECCRVILNGTGAGYSNVGNRFNLKTERGTADFVKDKDTCVLDVVDVALPKGAAGIVTFRLHCL